MRNYTTLIAPFALAALLGGTSALAADMEEDVTTMTYEWESLDVDRDGYLTREEIDDDNLLGEWDTLDVNDDDMLEESEFAEFEIEEEGIFDDEIEIEMEEEGLFGDETELEIDDGQIEME